RARLLDEALGLRDVLRGVGARVPVGLEDVAAVAPRPRAGERARELRVAVVHVLDVGLAVDGERERLPDTHVPERALEVRDHDRVARERRALRDRDLVLRRLALGDRAHALRL